MKQSNGFRSGRTSYIKLYWHYSCLELLLVIFRQFSTVSIQYHENEFMDFNETSSIEVFHFADGIVFSDLFNN